MPADLPGASPQSPPSATTPSARSSFLPYSPGADNDAFSQRQLQPLNTFSNNASPGETTFSPHVLTRLVNPDLDEIPAAYPSWTQSRTVPPHSVIQETQVAQNTLLDRAANGFNQASASGNGRRPWPGVEQDVKFHKSETSDHGLLNPAGSDSETLWKR